MSDVSDPPCRHGLYVDCVDCFMEVCGGSEYASNDDAIAHGSRWREALDAIVRHHAMPAGESWEAAYNEVCTIAIEARCQ